MPQELLALAERCENATGPDRELDVAIYEVVSGERHRPTRFGPEERGGHVVKAYTASLDAAMTLVPEGWARRIDYRPAGLDLPVGCDTSPAIAMVYRSLAEAYRGDAPTEALALTAAALRARAHQSEITGPGAR